MQSSLQNRDSDLSPATTLPGNQPGARTGSETRASASIIPSQMLELGEIASRYDLNLEDVLLRGFAILLTRLTRQDVVNICLGQMVMYQFVLGDCSFSTILTHSSADCKVSNDPQEGESQKSPGSSFGKVQDPGSHFEFWSKSESVVPHSSCGLRLTVANGGRDVELVSPIGLWSGHTLNSWLRHLLGLLHSACESPELRVNELPLWRDSEARAFYTELNSTGREFDGPRSVESQISAHASITPNHLAVASEGLSYSYQDIQEISDRIARELGLHGAKANCAVAVCMERSANLPVALLGVLKSGAFYVPLDPHNPPQRLKGILEECEPIAVIADLHTADALKDSLPSPTMPVVLVDALTARSSETALAAAPVMAELSDLAYTIYTSGTTGKPKGVRITRGALLNLIDSMGRSPGLTTTDRTLAVAPISFDIATMDMFLPLCTGGTLVIASRNDAVDPYRIADLLVEHDITCMQATPVTWRMLVTSDWQGKRDLKMITGGEAIPRELANTLLRVGGELWNCYGPTETTIYSAVIQLHTAKGIVPVGPPMPNTSFYVMDAAGNPLPPGFAGELYIGGAGVSPGYVARPELTAERFVPDRFGDRGGRQAVATLFRTGDLVRLVEGNVFEFFGRLDHQVKLRGFRIELGEIESVLRTHPSISDAVVILREDIPGEARLAGYVIPSGGKVDATALKEHAARSLPEYMLPSVFVILEKFPLSTSGKIDRRGLPIPESVTEQIAPEQPRAIAPSGALETRLLRIFREVLRHDSIGVTDNFFSFGGYSLLTVRLFSRIDRELRVRLPISLLFDAPTVRELAAVISKGSSPSAIVPIRPKGRSAPLFIVQSYLLYNVMLDVVEPDRPIYGVREMADEREPMSVEERARHFASEILKVYPNGPLLLAGWCAAGTLTVEIARQLQVNGHVVALVALFDAERPGFAPPAGLSAWSSRLWRKAVFHFRRMQNIPWGARFTYLYEAMERNWDWAVESYYTANYHSMLWLQKRFGFSLSEAAFNNVYANLTAIKDFSAQPYPGKLSLFRAADVPDYRGVDETLGWGTIAMEGVEVNFVPGDHVSMFKKPHVADLAKRLRAELKKCEQAVTADERVSR